MAKSPLMSKILATAGKKGNAAILSQSGFLSKDVICQTKVPLINLMLGGSFDGGITPGVHMVVGESRTFKTNFCLALMAAFLEHDKDAVAIFVDSEFGAAKYFGTFGIDTDRVVHIPVEDLEQMKFSLIQTLEQIGGEDKVFIFIDSVSQLASKREVDNALSGNTAADMTRAKEFNSFWRIITPKLQLRKIPLFAINSFYEDIGNTYAEPTIKGGKQGFLSSDAIYFVTRSQIKDESTKELQGFTFNYSSMKSRYVKEKAKFPLTVTFDGGIDRHSGLFELARKACLITSEKQGWYNVQGLEGYDPAKSYRKAQLELDNAFFEKLVANETFREFCKNAYSLETGDMFTEEDVDMLTGEIKTKE